MTVKTYFSLLVKRARWELFRMTQRIPINTKYKPLGVQPVTRYNTEDSEYLELCPPHTSTLNLSEDFVRDCSPYMKPALSALSAGDFILTLKQGRIYCKDFLSIAVINRANCVVDEVSYQWGDDEIAPTQSNAVFATKGFTKPSVYKGRVFSLLSGGVAKHYYYHWVFETMPKLYLLQKSGQFNKVDHFIVPRYALNFQKQYLAHFGITPEKIINEDNVHHIQADLLMVTSPILHHDHHSHWVCEFLYRSFIKKSGLRSNTNRIYISRGDATRNRPVYGESQLLEMLQRFGFESYHLSALTVEAQALLFNSASIVVGSHGGGLSNLVYCRPGTIVLELFPDQYVRHLFYDVANKSGLDYHYLTFPSDGTANSSVRGQQLGLKVDVDVVRKKVQSLLSLQHVS